MDNREALCATDVSTENDLSFSYARPVPHCDRFPGAERPSHQARQAVGGATNQRPNDTNQDRVSVQMLTGKNLEEHNRQTRLCANVESCLELRQQSFERFREAAKALGIVFSDQVLAAMWQGLRGLTPMERFISGKDDLSVLGVVGPASGQEELKIESENASMEILGAESPTHPCQLRYNAYQQK